ncbi:unnamed protein product [Brachionus calyciflorus]|uniref:Uncharacterized protein n=1 Tax=Brachionus calyciflorus TaxID=104777 RepID=A0A813YP56_9BILA|nr:unnamed protein product [Brachionus calyciflorus]
MNTFSLLDKLKKRLLHYFTNSGIVACVDDNFEYNYSFMNEDSSKSCPIIANTDAELCWSFDELQPNSFYNSNPSIRVVKSGWILQCIELKNENR